MKKLKKVILSAVIAIVLTVVIAISYITLALPNVGEPDDIRVTLTNEKIARGEYLANHVSLCTDCHSQRDWSKFAGPIVDGRLGEGGELFDSKVDFPGSVHVPNITPFNLKEWTDGEIFRAITAGVRKDGSAIFPLMPWPSYSKMSREDIYAIIAYLRTLKPVEANYPKASYDFPLNILVHTFPKKAVPGINPSPADTIKYGAYLVNAAACMDCHTKNVKGKAVPGMDFAGGREFKIGNNTIRSANITPDTETGIGRWTSASFLQRFKSFNDPAKAATISETDFQTIMPWYDYSRITENDLKAMFAYLRTLKPISNKVIKFTVNSFALTKSN
ncbi:c-type cytochrome [Mucilaginibacter xinganensis]|uniref:Cytochrome C n=1 Tax=Mucilaginibacter xinganensis TaxID=1234841 RepID=A0A223NVE9_9SPHI|nr:c-type cytochrome [Mucilaginibacter xinganensis]ASU33837.1 cytochrome C [Mucilaginibacter xinganensis]